MPSKNQKTMTKFLVTLLLKAIHLHPQNERYKLYLLPSTNTAFADISLKTRYYFGKPCSFLEMSVHDSILFSSSAISSNS